ncbi:hypothetical protein [Dechloromonas sp. H13]|uniref:hypothetical protein n=1 Tax=Dechloromonas sp. H13 TaxID=2570193 RepID=UPI0012911F05|nr:hypothetical protein [Dechloromonas sp. H13]
MSAHTIFGPFRLSTAAALAALLAACAGGPTSDGEAPAPRARAASLQVGYACCNLHYDGDLVSDSNYGQLPFVAAGTPLRVTKIDGYVAHVDVDGRSLRLLLEHRDQETMQEWLGRIVVADDPRPKIAAFPPPVRDAVKAGRLLKGMTREQVIIAVGYPQTSDKFRLDGPSWRYWWSGFAPYYVYWSANKLSRIDGQAEVVGAVTYKGR